MSQIKRICFWGTWIPHPCSMSNCATPGGSLMPLSLSRPVKWAANLLLFQPPRGVAGTAGEVCAEGRGPHSCVCGWSLDSTRRASRRTRHLPRRGSSPLLSSWSARPLVPKTEQGFGDCLSLEEYLLFYSSLLFQVYSKVIQLNTHIYITEYIYTFSDDFPLQFITRC